MKEQKAMASSQVDIARPGITQLLQAWRKGDEGALDQLAPLVESELHRLARKYLRQERAHRPLETTELVNEVYLRLIGSQQVGWRDRAHFFAVSARMMRRILADFARSRYSQKRGGGAITVTCDEELAVSKEPDADIVSIDHALNELAALDPRKTQVVELRFFGGLSVEETAEVLKISARTVLRDWEFAKSWLMRALSERQGR
jgi:RNA polymerase sigma factor (TIGR02999 family)